MFISLIVNSLQALICRRSARKADQLLGVESITPAPATDVKLSTALRVFFAIKNKNPQFQKEI
jgi:hypothetical protein